MSRIGFISSLAVLMALGPGSSGRAQDRSPRGMAERFENSKPAIGDPLPNVSAYDAQGKPFQLSSLKGHYTVLVFGCLT